MAAHCFDATTFVGPCNHKARGQHHNPPAPGRSHYLKIKRKQVCNKFFIGMKRIHTILIILLLAVTYGEAKKSSDDRQMDDFITSLMKKMTLEEVDQSAFERAADTILSARTIYIVGIRSCAPLASFLAFYLHMIFPDVRQVQTNSSSEIFEQMIRITEDDVVIGISFPRYSMRTMKALEFANSRKAKVITITDSVHSPMNVYAACTLIAKSDMASIVDSLVAPLSVINALVVALCMKRQADVKKTLESMEKLWDEYQVYSNDEINGLDDARPMGGKRAALPVKEKA